MGSEKIVISGKGIFGMASSPTMLWMEKALNTLNKEDKELLAHIYCQEESLRSIAQSTGVPFTTLQYRHKKVIKKLRHFFEQNFLLLD